MASQLKRKRDPVEVLSTPKRSKSVKTKSSNHISFNEKIGREAAFQKPKRGESAPRNGVNGESQNSSDISSSPEAVYFEEFVGEKLEEGLEEGGAIQTMPKKTSRAPATEARRKRKIESFEVQQKGPVKMKPWKLSEPIGGRMINVDPVFSQHEKYIILANRSAIHVYSTSNSLLTRTIKPKVDTGDGSAQIITYTLSPTHPNILWVACSDGKIFSIDWTSGAGTEDYWTISSTGCTNMTVASMESAGRRRDVVFTTEPKKDGGFRITANELTGAGSPIKTAARTIYTSSQRIQILKTVKEGSVIVGASENRILIGRLRSTEYDTVDKIRYEFRVFQSADAIKSLDARITERRDTPDLRKSSLKMAPVVDLVVGDVRGVIFLHNDLLAKLFLQPQDGKTPGISLVPRKLHWHRQAVHAVKWSLDGNYIISGGTETVLVLWQLDTGKQQFLPHLSATIQNVVVSPTGTSYAVQLSDNSTMVLSTAELKPTANVAGIQASVVQSRPQIESLVRRVKEPSWQTPVLQRTLAAVNLSEPSRLILAVGQMQEVRSANPFIVNNPFLQTFDLSSGRNVSCQALARTNITNLNTGPTGHRITEPRVTHLKLSHDGNWLVTIDEWMPPEQDVAFLAHSQKDVPIEQQHRREVFLKFWQWSSEGGIWELVSKVEAPHATRFFPGDAGRILDIAADPSSLRFATIGEDDTVRTWTTKVRKRDGIVRRGADKKPLRNWRCKQEISLGKPGLLDGSEHDDLRLATGCITFSDDGSVLAAACGNEDGLLHILDPHDGIIRRSYTGMFEDDIIHMAFLGQNLITVSNRLLIFDLVAEEILSREFLKACEHLSSEQKQEMVHLAVDHRSGTFAVALPVFETENNLKGARSLLQVLHPDDPSTGFLESLPTLVTALLPTISSEGYLALDSAAEIYTVLKKGTQAITAQAQSTSALMLDATPEEATHGLIQIVEPIEDEDAEEHGPLTPAATVDEEDDDEHPVVTQQQLAAIFDIGPAYAMPPMEELFYQVAALCSGPPLPRKG